MATRQSEVTRLLAGAVGLIILGALTLVIGWLGANEVLIWASIGASAGAAVLLALAYHRGRSLRPSPAEGAPRKKRRTKRA